MVYRWWDWCWFLLSLNFFLIVSYVFLTHLLLSSWLCPRIRISTYYIFGLIRSAEGPPFWSPLIIPFSATFSSSITPLGWPLDLLTSFKFLSVSFTSHFPYCDVISFLWALAFFILCSPTLFLVLVTFLYKLIWPLPFLFILILFLSAHTPFLVLHLLPALLRWSQVLGLPSGSLASQLQA